jgi:hypothetical protein
MEAQTDNCGEAMLNVSSRSPRFQRYERPVQIVTWVHNHSNMLSATLRREHRSFEHVLLFHVLVFVTLRSIDENHL